MVETTISGLRHGAGFVLFVDDGQLAMLEGFSYDGPWPQDIKEFSLRCWDPARESLFASLSLVRGTD